VKRKLIVSIALAATLVCGASITPAMAYFTDNTEATGSIPIKIGTTTTIHEWYREKVKYVKIGNSEDSDSPVWIRAKVQTNIEYSTEGADNPSNWPSSPDANDWYNYSTPVDPGEAAEILKVQLTFPTVKSETKPGAEIGDNFNVIVVYESTPAEYDESTQSYKAPNWDNVLDRVTEGVN